jgi:hypothetical protein
LAPLRDVIKLDNLRDVMKRVPFAGKFGFNSEPEQKENPGAPDAKDAAGADLSKPAVTQRIGDKVFHFEKAKGMWIDQEYKPEMEKWSRWTLRRDSKEYKEILDSDPSLKVFFDRGPILIVWKNGIYKVLK